MTWYLNQETVITAAYEIDHIGKPGEVMKCQISRLSDGHWWNGSIWTIGIETLSMQEQDPVNNPGLFWFSFTPTAIGIYFVRIFDIGSTVDQSESVECINLSTVPATVSGATTSKNPDIYNTDQIYVYSLLVTVAGQPLPVDVGTVPQLLMFIDSAPSANYTTSLQRRGTTIGSYMTIIPNINSYKGTEFTFICSYVVSGTTRTTQETVRRIDTSRLNWIYTKLTSESQNSIS